MDRVQNNLWISDINAVREQSTSDFDVVITVCQDSTESNVGCEYAHYKLADGEPEGHNQGECSYPLFKEAADRVLDCLKNQETVLVHCHAGQSRSVAISVAALSVYEDIPYGGAYQLVEEARPQANPNYVLRGFAKQYIEESDSGSVELNFR